MTNYGIDNLREAVKVIVRSTGRAEHFVIGRTASRLMLAQALQRGDDDSVRIVDGGAEIPMLGQHNIPAYIIRVYGYPVLIRYDDYHEIMEAYGYGNQ